MQEEEGTEDILHSNTAYQIPSVKFSFRQLWCLTSRDSIRLRVFLFPPSV